MPTVRDVAKRAGVAPITVSRVINQSGYVSVETRQRVEAAVGELGYVPNKLARGLRLKQTNTLGLVLTDITNPFWTMIARGVEDTAHQAGWTVILCNTDESQDKQAQYLTVLLQKQVDGILLIPARSAAEPIQAIQRQGVPVVVLDRRVPGAQVDVVRCDSEGGACQLVRHLVSLGHRRIAALSGPQDVSTALDRVAGYRRALAEAGLAIREGWVRHGQFSQASGYEMTQQVLALVPRPTALFAANNFIAIGVLRALRGAGLRVPQDMSLVAFDDLTADLLIEPFLTVLDQPAYEMGQRATDLLLLRLSRQSYRWRRDLRDTDRQETDGYQEVVLPTEIVVRRSCGPPPVTPQT